MITKSLFGDAQSNGRVENAILKRTGSHQNDLAQSAKHQWTANCQDPVPFTWLVESVGAVDGRQHGFAGARYLYWRLFTRVDSSENEDSEASRDTIVHALDAARIFSNLGNSAATAESALKPHRRPHSTFASQPEKQHFSNKMRTSFQRAKIGSAWNNTAS